MDFRVRMKIGKWTYSTVQTLEPVKLNVLFETHKIKWAHSHLSITKSMLMWLFSSPLPLWPLFEDLLCARHRARGFTPFISWLLRKDFLERLFTFHIFRNRKPRVRGIKELAIFHAGIPQRSPSWEVANRSWTPGLSNSESAKLLIIAYRTNPGLFTVQLQ